VAVKVVVAAVVSTVLSGLVLGIAGPRTCGQDPSVPQPCPALVLAAAAASPVSIPASPTPPRSEPGSLHPGDKIAVTVFDHPELSGDVTVGSDFTIVVPLAGSVDIRNLNVNGVARAIEKNLAEYVVSPAVDVKLVSRSNTMFLAGNAAGSPAHVSVGGSVAKAGVVVLRGDRSLVSALALAGGPSKEGNLHAIVVKRAAKNASASAVPGAQSYDLTALANGNTAQNPDLFEGDAVYVTQAKPHVDPRALFAAILLAAKKHGKVP
jgi:polysaccharide export outer membrane protein